MPEVWIADDDEAIRFVLSEAFCARPGASVRMFADAESLLDELKRTQPAVIVSDVRMPGASGLALLERLREIHNRVPVIVMSAFTDVALDRGCVSQRRVRLSAQTLRSGSGRIRGRACARRNADGDRAGACQQRRNRAHRPRTGDARSVPAYRRRRRERSERIDHRADRHRQGTRRTRPASAQRARGACLCRSQHRGDSDRTASNPNCLGHEAGAFIGVATTSATSKAASSRRRAAPLFSR